MKKCVSYCFVFVVTDAKIATIFEYPNKFLLLSKNLCSGSLKIAIQHPKISVRYLKISVLKIAVHSLKIAGLKIIARVCVYVCAWVRGCAPHFAEVSKMAQDAHGAGTQAPERPPKREHHHRTQATGATTTRAGAPAHAHPIRKRKLKNNSK